MEELLPYYERELGFLRRYAREFSERYPKIAGRLLLSGDVSQDPHVERLIESFALLAARVSKRIEDDQPEFTEALLEVLYPHYLRPFPSCSIAQFDPGPAAAQMSGPAVIPAGTELQSRPARGVNCRFRTAYPVTLAPLRIAAAGFAPVIEAPETVNLPARAGASLSIDLELLGETGNLAALGLQRLRLFTDGEPSFCAALRDALGLRVVGAYAEAAGSGRWQALTGNPLSPVGFADEEALIDWPARSHPAYRLLTEFFAFPDKFGFFDLDLAALPVMASRRVRLHFVLAGIPADSPAARLLGGLGTDNLRLGCTPVVNLFRQQGEPIRVSHSAVSYPVLADARRPYAYEVHAIESVRRIRHTPQGEQVTEFRPFYSLRHGERPEAGEHYWFTRRDELVGRQSPGHELEIGLVDLDFNPVTPQTEVLSLGLLCSNRDLPTQLAYGVPGGDLSMEGGGIARSISLLRKPTPPMRFERGRGAQWRLISHLSLDHLSLAGGGLAAFKEVLRLYDLPRSAISGRQIEGVVGLEHRPATAWLPGQQFASVVRGVEVRMSVDEDSFVGAGIHVFAQVMDRFFGLYVHVNSFTRLVLVSQRSGEELLRCSPRNGDSILV